jgi:trans-2,3-dihydro-3-hydroxyanthranilate isomerase
MFSSSIKQLKMKIPFHLVDVFVDRPITGNPLAIIPPAEGLDDSVTMSIARELHHAETTLLFAATRRSANWRLRSFAASGVEVFGAGPRREVVAGRVRNVEYG